MRLDVLLSNQTIKSYSTGYAFSLNEWAFLGISMYNTKRFSMMYNINLVVKTKSLVLTQQSFTSENISIYCSNANSQTGMSTL